MNDLGEHQNSIESLPDLNKNLFENLFTIYKQDDLYFYNILRTISFPDELDHKFYFEYTITSPEPLTNLSYKFYGSIELWWVICLANQISNPVEMIPGGTTLKIIRSNYIETIIEKLQPTNQ